MEKNETSIDKPKGKHGGARPGSGRPKGRKDSITIGGLLEQVYQQSGKDYTELLVEDFVQARNQNDSQLLLKYHNLILNKVMNTLAKVEVTDSADAVAAKQAAFTEALAKLTGINPE
jgi:hypothetical protein